MISNPKADEIPETEPKFYLSHENEIFGPHTPGEIQELLDRNVIGRESLLWTEGMEEWVPLEQMGASPPLEEEGLPGTSDPAAEAVELSEADLPTDESLAAGSVIGPSPAKRFRVSDTFTPEGGVAMPYDDRMGPRLGSGFAVALVVHLLLLAFLIWQAPRLFHIVSYPAAVQPTEAPPLEVAMVSQDDTAPPPETPRPIAETPPPPVEPPPPPSIPEVPLDTPPPTSEPAAFAPPTLPQPDVASPALPSPAPSRPQPEKMRRPAHPTSTPSAAPSATTPTNAGPSDYLYAPQPDYPRTEKMQHHEGTVILIVKINDGGEPIDVQVWRSSGHTVLDKAARDCVAENYRFKPGNLRLLLVPIVYQIR